MESKLSEEIVNEQMQKFKYGGLWRRLIAHIIDNIIVLTGSSIIGFFVITLTGLDSSDRIFEYIELGVILLLNIFYYGYLESSSKRASLGKQILGLEVSYIDGSSITFGLAALRFVYAVLVEVLTLGLGFLTITFTGKKQCLHDIMSNCIVIRSK